MADTHRSPTNRRRSNRRTAALAAIHLGWKALGWDEETYRTVLRELTGHDSAKDLSPLECARVLDFMRQRGFTHAPGRSARPAAASPDAATEGTATEGTATPEKRPQLRLIRTYWGALAAAGRLRDPSERGLRAFVQRTTGVTALPWLTAEQASKVIEGLKAWLARGDAPAPVAARAQPTRAVE